MWKLKAVIKLIFADRFCLFTDNNTGLDSVHINFRIRDAEDATGYLLDQIASTLACEEAVLKAKEIINN